MTSEILSQSAATADLATLRHQLLDLFCELAYREGDFVLSSGKKSTYYINGKQVTLHPQGAVATGRLLFSLLPADTQAVAGLTLGADPIVSAVSVISVYENRPIPALIVRKEAKDHGTMAYIEGNRLPAESKVVVLEDVVTTGQSAMKAVQRLRDAGYQVEEVISLVDRQEGGAEFYASVGLKFQAVFTIAEIQQWFRKSQPA
ncbi:orotate phosphoribosyltransferase [Desertifilum sp. FACHB-1129]|uniref:Orotate phosphoribosyltransferase n=1 Tax=Desertifilum tharense IPPAS B-1220 TaxID=1781255 RepID=A0A1E5QIL4_9CYAN|nr:MULTISPECIES: orotate phosphoribosyltransferase [Cyanophyceae]MDA0212391.1 orotate phosphoribosyltransferase [Cyanobacteria bacterium FC1]MBD2311733.1 orotate phosphoribosyltransferase [Desertifilum sp. FACHB-1129]MBD2322742.1 orotate phosphoribosyltransferase [Desertifilum sp. FACHB-866]MBD2332864.1 orotate phosphoribosyltransferase [Desertifilum sp. FACHB-868]MDL5052009.1 orotate phosphoribosyltransferase [Oscillatoria laete-virens NRMC-F 0139]